MTAIFNPSIRCIIADLIVEVPAVGDLVTRCAEYKYDGEEGADIVIRTDLFRKDMWQKLSRENYMYIESGRCFYAELLMHKGMMLHASAVDLGGKAYLFSAPSGTGKSTHTRLWKEKFGEDAVVFNDDKPAIRCVDGVWYAYGTPWCGKDGINDNRGVPLAGICFLKQALHNRMRRLTVVEAIPKILSQTLYRSKTEEKIDYLLPLIEDILKKIPIFELENKPDQDAVEISSTAMLNAAREAGL